MQFTATIQLRGINPYVLVSAARAKKIQSPWRKPMPVLVRINGKPSRPWRINMMPAGDGSYYLYLHGDVRRASETKIGDRVRVEVAFDAKYVDAPSHRMPAWFKNALSKNRAALKNWGELIPSRKKEILRYLSNLKSPEARLRNTKRALAALSGTRARYMARSWNEKR